MPSDYSKVKGRIVEMCGTQGMFAKLIGLSERTVSLKLSGRRPFYQSDIEKSLIALHLTHADIPAYFFTLKVQ